MKTIKIDINLAVVIFLLIGLVFGVLIGMLIQGAIIQEQILSLFEKVKIENVNINFNETKIIEGFKPILEQEIKILEDKNAK